MAKMNLLDGLPRHGSEALEPCTLCHTPILASGMPIFYRMTIRQCGVDSAAISSTVGLAMHFGGGERGLAIAQVMGPRTEPVVEMGCQTVNVCHNCANANPVIYQLAMPE